MKLIHSDTQQTITRRINVVDGLVLDVPRSDTGKTFRLERLNITFHEVSGAWREQHIQAVGPVLKKDGTDSKNQFSGAPPYAWASDVTWGPLLDGIINAVRPVGQVQLPFNPTPFDYAGASAREGFRDSGPFLATPCATPGCGHTLNWHSTGSARTACQAGRCECKQFTNPAKEA